MNNTPNLVAYAAKLIIKSEKEIFRECWQKAIKDYFKNIGTQCKDLGVVAIGHIKGFLSFSTDDCYCYFSYVDNNQGTSCQGKIDRGLMEGTLDFNVLVYGGDIQKVDKIVNYCTELLENDLNCKCILSKSK